MATGVSGFDNSEVLTSRPFSGCAIFWRKSIDAHITVVDTDSRRMCAVRMCSDTAKLLLINMYMPFQDTNSKISMTRTEEFVTLLSSVEYLSNENQDCTVIIGGDFNVDFHGDSCHTNILNKFCIDNNLYPVVRHSASSVDYTYQFNMSRFCVLDHFVIPEVLFDTAVDSFVEHSVDNRSDHEPLFLRLKIPSYYTSCSNKVFIRKVAWHKANLEHISDYRSAVQANLHLCALPVDALLCRDVLCRYAEHQRQLNKYANDITRSCLTAAEATVPMTSNRHYNGVVPGWNDEAAPVRQNSILWHNLWVDCGRPHSVVRWQIS